MKPIILASGSLRRKELLSKAGIQFKVDPSDYIEDLSLDENPQELVRKLSLGKAMAVAKKHPHSIVIGADTVVVFENQILGKPHTKKRAIEMLNMLNGKIHTVITGYTIIETDTDKHISESVKTQVTFKRVSQKEIIAYVETGEPLNKAGSYAVQEHGGFLIKEIKGDYNNVVGLPLVSLLTSLQKVLRVPESANNIDMV